MNTANTTGTKGANRNIDQKKLEEFKTGFRGGVLSPDVHGYDQARKIWNGMFDKKPALIARCVGTSDVIRAVNFARDNNLRGRGVFDNSLTDRNSLIFIEIINLDFNFVNCYE